MLGALSRQELGDMKRPELQRLCKENGLKGGNQKKEILVGLLATFFEHASREPSVVSDIGVDAEEEKDVEPIVSTRRKAAAPATTTRKSVMRKAAPDVTSKAVGSRGTRAAKAVQAEIEVEPIEVEMAEAVAVEDAIPAETESSDAKAVDHLLPPSFPESFATTSTTESTTNEILLAQKQIEELKEELTRLPTRADWEEFQREWVAVQEASKKGNIEWVKRDEVERIVEKRVQERLDEFGDRLSALEKARETPQLLPSPHLVGTSRAPDAPFISSRSSSFSKHIRSTSAQGASEPPHPFSHPPASSSLTFAPPPSTSSHPLSYGFGLGLGDLPGSTPNKSNVPGTSTPAETSYQGLGLGSIRKKSRPSLSSSRIFSGQSEMDVGTVEGLLGDAIDGEDDEEGQGGLAGDDQESDNDFEVRQEKNVAMDIVEEDVLSSAPLDLATSSAPSDEPHTDLLTTPPSRSSPSLHSDNSMTPASKGTSLVSAAISPPPPIVPRSMSRPNSSTKPKSYSSAPSPSKPTPSSRTKPSSYSSSSFTKPPSSSSASVSTFAGMPSSTLASIPQGVMAATPHSPPAQSGLPFPLFATSPKPPRKAPTSPTLGFNSPRKAGALTPGRGRGVIPVMMEGVAREGGETPRAARSRVGSRPPVPTAGEIPFPMNVVAGTPRSSGPSSSFFSSLHAPAAPVIPATAAFGQPSPQVQASHQPVFPSSLLPPLPTNGPLSLSPSFLSSPQMTSPFHQPQPVPSPRNSSRNMGPISHLPFPFSFVPSPAPVTRTQSSHTVNADTPPAQKTLFGTEREADSRFGDDES